MAGSDLIVASNRGPLSFALDEHGKPVPSGSAGGLAAALHPMLEGTGATWLSCAMTDADRLATAEGMMAEGGLRLITVQPNPDAYRMAYDVVSNSMLWFLHHHLFDLSRRPRLDRHFAEAYDAYRALNESFATKAADAASDGAAVLVQDYHLCLVPAMLARMRPDVRTVHFTHTPFADPNVIRILPDAVATDLLHGMAAARACGFHTTRWESAFRACCATYGIDPGGTFVSPLGVDADYLAARAASKGCIDAGVRLDDLLAGRRMVLRVDRMEPSKNLLRGFWAFDELLRSRPDLRGTVVMVALAYSSRQSLPEYQAYGTEAEYSAERVNDTWATDDWTPVILDVADDPDRSVAALTRYDVLLVNPVRDGLNLVAKEGPLLNTVDGVLALSREAGSFDALGGPALEINPFDVAGTADVLGTALDMGPGERAERASSVRSIVAQRTPGDWLADLLGAAGN